MSSQTFEPYWYKLPNSYFNDADEDPYSWVFFVVSKIHSKYQPLAVVTSRGNKIDGSLRGQHLVSTCQRIVRIFSTTTNHAAIRAEIAVAERFGYESHETEEHELPELDWKSGIPREAAFQTPDLQSPVRFPFISTCLLSGVKWNSFQTWQRTQPARLASLGTVYRDTSIEWGMVVIDITDLKAVAYGIVSFCIAPMRYITNRGVEAMIKNPQTLVPTSFNHGEIRVAESPRARKALSASEYLTRFPVSSRAREEEEKEDDSISQLLSGIPTVSEASMDLIWPLTTVNTPYPRLLPDFTSKGAPKTVIIKSSKATSAVPTKGLTATDLQLSPALPASSLEIDAQNDMIINDSHLDLERLPDPLSALCFQMMVTSNASRITSITVCLDDCTCEISQLVTNLLKFENLRELYAVACPNRTNDDASVEFYRRIIAADSFSDLCKAKLVIMGLYSNGTTKRDWLASSLGTVGSAVIKEAHFKRYPIQQVLFFTNYGFSSTYLGDAMLSPERFVIGLLDCLRVLARYHQFDNHTAEAHLFAFSSCPSTFDLSHPQDIDISPIPAEGYMTLGMRLPGLDSGVCLHRDLTPESWTVLVRQGPPFDLPLSIGDGLCEYCLQYAFVRPRRHRIAIEATLPPGLTPEDFEVLDIFEFLSQYMGKENVHRNSDLKKRLKDLNEAITSSLREVELPEQVSRVAAMSPEQVLKRLPEYLETAQEANESIIDAMKERGIPIPRL